MTAPFYTRPDHEWPDTWCLCARDSHDREFEFSRVVLPELAVRIAELLNAAGCEPDFWTLDQ
jgi:hypothetical protein